MDSKLTQFESKVKKTIKDYGLLSRKDKIIVACSGGKDSTTALYLLRKLGYDAEALIIDLQIGDWSQKNLENIKKFCKEQKIKLHVIDLRKEFGGSMCYIRSAIQSKADFRNCMICGVIKRWIINKKAKQLKAAKVATGHNIDDEAQTILMNIFRGNLKMAVSLGPKTGIIKDDKFVQRIKPLYFCSNLEIEAYSKAMNFPVLYEPCPCAADSLRRQIKLKLNEMEKNHPGTKLNIVNKFLEILPELREKFRSGGELKYCKICGEPARNDVCKACQLVGVLKSQ